MKSTLPDMIKDCDKHGYRVIHYPETTEKKLTSRAEAHGDICLLTLLPNASSKGLALLDCNGTWHSPEIATNEIVVFNSDMLELCTNGYLKSTIHKVNLNVRHEKNPARYSFPIFIHPRRETELKSGLTALDALRKRLTEIGYRGHLLKK
ncbi:MAG: hypothetical protein NTZ67_00645 [Gammaproteobacteria bacterium]|nr:hypothetical protein [Gammaproteobacteria bacterium]